MKLNTSLGGNAWKRTFSNAHPFLFTLDSLKSLGLWLGVILCAACITCWYIANERVFYFWDYAFYMDMASGVSKMFNQNPIQALETIYLSTALDYNYYFTLPLVPFLQIFKYSRLGYILGLVFVYHIPTMVAFGYVVRKIFPSVPYSGWVTILVGLSIPALWASIFQGFPDIGAVFLITLTLVVYLQDMELKQWQFQLPMIGAISALVIIFRRHFAYSVVSFWFSMGVFFIYVSIRNSGKNWKNFFCACWNTFVKTTIIFAFFLLALILLAPGLLLKMFYTNYLNLYESYASYPHQVFIFFFTAFGILWLLTSLGFLASVEKIQAFFRFDVNNIHGRSLNFILFFGLTSLGVWVFIPRQIDVHYVLHVAPFVVVGITAFAIMTLNIKTIYHTLANGFVVLLLIYNLWAGLAPANLVPVPTTLSYPPLYREDYDEIKNLVNYLRRTAGRDGYIYIVDSSTLMNSDIVHNAELSQYKDNSFLQILHSPQVDSRDFYPLDSILRADYIVITTPFQCHLREEEQKVVKFTFDAFSKEWIISRDFQKLPEQFHLMGRAVLSVYKRQSISSLETILSTFDQMQKYIGRLPGGQSDWISITPRWESNMEYGRQDKQHFSINISNHSPVLSFLYLGNKRSLTTLTGKVDHSADGCSPIEISADVFLLSTPVSLLRKEQLVLSNGEFNLDVPITDNTALILSFRKNVNSSETLCDTIVRWEMIEIDF
jgi:hypothetical protein